MCSLCGNMNHQKYDNSIKRVSSPPEDWKESFSDYWMKNEVRLPGCALTFDDTVAFISDLLLSHEQKIKSELKEKLKSRLKYNGENNCDYFCDHGDGIIGYDGEINLNSIFE